MSGFLLDTCTVRKWFSKQPGVSARIAAIDDKMPLFISAITRGEIEFAHSNQASLPAQQADFRKWMREAFALNELDITFSTGEEYGKLRRACFELFDKKHKYAECREDQLGRKCGIDENDLWLAAQALERNLQLITVDGMVRIREVLAKIDAADRIIVWPDD